MVSTIAPFFKYSLAHHCVGSEMAACNTLGYTTCCDGGVLLWSMTTHACNKSLFAMLGRLVRGLFYTQRNSRIPQRMVSTVNFTDLEFFIIAFPGQLTVTKRHMVQMLINFRLSVSCKNQKPEMDLYFVLNSKIMMVISATDLEGGELLSSLFSLSLSVHTC